MPAARTSSRTRLLSVLGLLALPYVVYLVVANVLLMTSLGPALAEDADRKLRWRTGYSVLPLRAHLSALEVDVRERGSSWHVEARRAVGTFSFTSVVSGRVHLTSAELDDVVVGERRARAPSPEDDRARAPTSDVPTSLAIVRPIPGEQSSSRGCSTRRAKFRIDRIRATNIHEIRVGSASFFGSARADGGFVSCPLASRLDDVKLEVADGEILGASVRLLERVRGRAAFENLELGRETGSNALLSVHDASVVLDGRVVDARVLARDRSRAGEVTGSLHADLRVDGSALLPGSNARLRVGSGADAETPIEADVNLMVEEDGSAKLALVASEVGWDRGRGETSGAADLRARLRAPLIELAAPLRNVSGTIDANGLSLDVGSLPPFGALLQRETTVHGHSHLDVDAGIASGTMAFHTPEAKLAFGAAVVAGPLALDVDLQSWRVGSNEALLRAVAKHRSGEGETTTLELDDARVRLSHPRSIDGTLVFELSDALPALRALTSSAELPALVTVLASSTPIAGEGSMRADARTFEVNDLRGRAGALSFQGAFTQPSTRPRDRRATLLFESGPFAVGADIDGEETTFILADARRWFARTVPPPSPR